MFAARSASVLAGTALKASSVGANSVYGPVPRRVSASPASLISLARVESCGVRATVSVTETGDGAVAQPASAARATAAPANSQVLLFIQGSYRFSCPCEEAGWSEATG